VRGEIEEAVGQDEVRGEEGEGKIYILLTWPLDLLYGRSKGINSNVASIARPAYGRGSVVNDEAAMALHLLSFLTMLVLCSRYNFCPGSSLSKHLCLLGSSQR